MSYPKGHADWLLTEAKICFCCKQPFVGREYREVHSTTSYHLILDVGDDGRDVFKVIDAPEIYPEMNGRTFELQNEFGLRDKYKADAVVVHRFCHDEIKLIALALCRGRNSDFRGNVPTPRTLHEVSHNFLRFRRLYAKSLRLNTKKKYPR